MRGKGFTLIEIMVVVAIVAILAAIAYPSYREQVMKSRRSDAKTALMHTAQVLERCYTEYYAFNDNNCVAVSGGGLASEYATSPEGYYNITTPALNATAFTLKASPAGSQAGDRCGSFTYTHTGHKGVSGDGDGDGDSGDEDDVKTCW